ALPYRRSVLRATRAVHDVLVTAFLPLAIWSVGFHGPELLAGGEWSRLPIGWAVYFAFCAAGIVSLIAAVVREESRVDTSIQAAALVDVAAKIGHVPAGPGFRGRIAKLPGNEVFLLEISEKHYVLPRLPDELDGLSIAHVSDTHFRGPITRDYFQYAFDGIADLQADLIAFTGDLLDEQELVDWLPETFGRLSAPLGCWFILGNHDWLLDPDPMRISLRKLGWNDIGSTSALIQHNGKRIALAGDETPWLGNHPDLSACGFADLTVLLSHTPDNFGWANRCGVDLMLSGHNHGGQVCLPLIGPVYSPSRYGVRYARGSFHGKTTTLHVSRGLSAERPLRWNCPPEITKIVLRSSKDEGKK
ncbi:MAG: metallophosphoesterase, partial [Planctomycetota bacterium]|nr:metallophosphoesterase [Planctomycetota bacterium]